MNEENMLSMKFRVYEDLFTSIAPSMTDDQMKEWDNAISEYDKAEEKKYIQKRFENCGLGSEYWSCSFDSFNTDSEEKEKLKKFGQNFCRFVKSGCVKNLVLSGDCGSGKTHIAAAILREFAGNVKERVYDQPIYSKIRYTTTNDISDEFHDAESFGNSKSRMKVLSSYKDYDILVIDEVGRLVSKFENESDLLFRIIDARYQVGKSTVLITNMKAEEFRKHLNKATISRITAFDRLMYFDTKNISDFRKNKTA